VKKLIKAIDEALAAVPTKGGVAATFDSQCRLLTYHLDHCRGLAVNLALLAEDMAEDDPLRYRAPAKA